MPKAGRGVGVAVGVGVGVPAGVGVGVPPAAINCPCLDCLQKQVAEGELQAGLLPKGVQT